MQSNTGLGVRRNRVVKPLPNAKEMAEQVQAQIRAWAAMRMREAPEIDKVSGPAEAHRLPEPGTGTSAPAVSQ